MGKPSIPASEPVQSDEAFEAKDSGAGRRVRFGVGAKTLVTMTLVGLMPLALFGGITLRQQHERIRRDAELSMQASAERISEQVDEWFDKNLRVLQAAATLPALRMMGQQEQTSVLTSVQAAYPWIYLLHTIGLDGKNVARSDGMPLTGYADREYFRDIVANGKELSWETLIGRTSKKPALILAVPIKANGAAVGILTVAMGIDDISRIIATWKTGRTGYAFLVDEKGKVIAHPSEQFVLTQQQLDDHPLVSSFRKDWTPRLLAFKHDDGKEALGYVQGNRFRWALAVQQDEEELFAPLRQTLTFGLALLAGAAVLVTLTARFFSRVLTRPILRMTRAADRMSLGELERPIAFHSGDELGLLAQSLERLRKSMRAAMARLT